MSTTYNTYYTSSDVQIYFSSVESDNIVKIDTAIGISYTLNQTSTPIYDLGSRKANFFSIGNTICSGVLMFAFTDEEYLKTLIQYVTGDFSSPGTQSGGDNAVKNGGQLNTITITASAEYESKKYGIGSLSNKAFKDKALAKVNKTSNGSILSIGAINSLFDIKIYLNNETLITASDTKMICLKGCKIVQDAMEINSNSDGFLTHGYSLIFKDIERY